MKKTFGGKVCLNWRAEKLFILIRCTTSFFHSMKVYFSNLKGWRILFESVEPLVFLTPCLRSPTDHKNNIWLLPHSLGIACHDSVWTWKGKILENPTFSKNIRTVLNGSMTGWKTSRNDHCIAYYVVACFLKSVNVVEERMMNVLLQICWTHFSWRSWDSFRSINAHA